MEKNTTLAVDLAKSVYEVAVSQHPGRVAERHRLSRPAFERFLAERPAATVLMEACGSAHHWGRVARDLGHEPVLLPAHGVKPYVLRNKTDRSDKTGNTWPVAVGGIDTPSAAASVGATSCCTAGIE